LSRVTYNDDMNSAGNKLVELGQKSLEFFAEKCPTLAITKVLQTVQAMNSQDTVADVFFSLVDCIDDQCLELWFLGFGQHPECVEEIIAVECRIRLTLY
jgi:hypothetical protein